MNIRLVSQLIPVFASAVLVTACSQQPSVPEATGGAGSTSGSTAAGANTQGVNVGNGGGVSSTGAGANANAQANTNGAGAGKYTETYTVADLKNPNSLLSRRVIYFDYDLSSIKPEYQTILDAHAKLLGKNPQLTARLEGHADERGTREYNVALSEERAKAVQWYLRGKAVNSAQTEIIAYGEERPAKVGDGEQSWAQNRRVELRYPGQ